MKTISDVNTNKRAIIYCRVSTKEQVEEGNSLSTQEKICRDYALKNSYDIAKVFIEQGESAKTQDRTELQSLLRYCADRKNKISAIIAYKLDRISRNTDDYSQIRLLLKRYGVEIKSTSEYFENTPAGRFMENIIANVAQFDNDVRAERSTNGMRDAVRDGRYVWGAPIGYSNVRMGGKATIAPNEMAFLIKKSFELIGKNLYALEDARKIMIKEGLSNKAGKPICKSYFYYMLKNELYTGWIIKFGERHKGVFESIISEELFNKVQWVLKGRARRNFQYIWENPDFPLRRFVFHRESKHKLTGSWSKGRTLKYSYYRFGFKGTNYKRDELEATFIEYLNQFEFDDELFNAFKNSLKEHLYGSTKDKQNETEQLIKYIEQLKEKQNALIQKNLDGVITDLVLRQQLELIEKELFNSQAILAGMPKIKGNIEGLLEYIKPLLKNPGKIWAKAKFQLKYKLQWFQFPKGVYFDGKKFGTEEVCNLFKVKNSLLTSLSYRVPYLNQTWNQPKITNEENIAIEDLHSDIVYWEKIALEIEQLATILKESEGG